MTKRTSNNLWGNMKTNYDSLVSSLNVKELKDSLIDIFDTIKKEEFKFSIMYSTYIAIMILPCVLILLLYDNVEVAVIITKKIFLILPVIISVIICVIGIIASVCTIEIQVNSVETRLNKLDPNLQSSCRIIKKTNNDKKYFKYETGKTEFDKLSVAEIRELKTYYESDYMSTKKDADGADIESDLEEYLGGRDESKSLLQIY